MRSIVPVALALVAGAIAFGPPVASQAKSVAPPVVCAKCIAATMQHLADETFHGRKCGSADENAAAHYLADALKAEGVAGGLPDGGYLQAVTLRTPTYAAPPTLDLVGPGKTLRLTNGEQIAIGAAPERLEAPVVRLTTATPAKASVEGKIVILDIATGDGPSAAPAAALLKQGAVAVLYPANAMMQQHWGDIAARPPAPTVVVDGVAPRPPSKLGPVIYVKPEVIAELARMDLGEGRLSAPRGAVRERTTYNVIGKRAGAAPAADRQAILLSAHYDHLGVRNGVTYHGANDDASGTAAVMEFARVLGQGAPPRRSAYFAMFGCEEEGGLGAQYFLAHTPIPVDAFAANLEFEMIGNDDPKNPGALMLTGWERSNLGPTLKAHGALVGPDPYPEQNFFQRSDNYQLALKGVVAQTVSAWAVTPTYHQPTDDLAHLDLPLMDRAIGSLLTPVIWLLNSDFRPEWNPGQKP